MISTRLARSGDSFPLTTDECFMSKRHLSGKEGMRRLKILLADDHALMFEAIALALEDEDDMQIVGCAETGSAVLPLVERNNEVMIARV